MNENVKKATIVVVAVAAVFVAIWQGNSFFSEPKLQYIGKIGNFSKGHTGKQAMLAKEKVSLAGAGLSGHDSSK